MLTAIYGADPRHKLSFFLGLLLVAMVVAAAVLLAASSRGGGGAPTGPVLDVKMQTSGHGTAHGAGCCCCP
jgi:hypothetical protein